MRMSDIMSGLGLAIFPTVALVIFLAVFAGVVVTVGNRRKRAEFDAAAMLPLADDAEPHLNHGAVGSTTCAKDVREVRP